MKSPFLSRFGYWSFDLRHILAWKKLKKILPFLFGTLTREKLRATIKTSFKAKSRNLLKETEIFL